MFNVYYIFISHTHGECRASGVHRSLIDWVNISIYLESKFVWSFIGPENDQKSNLGGSSAPISGGFRTGDREESITSLDSSWNVTLDTSVVDIDDIQLLCTIGNCMDTSEGQVECGNSTPGNAVSCGDDDDADIACAQENVLLELNGIADGTSDHGWQEPGSVSETTQHGSVDAAGDAASRTDAELAQAVQKTRARTSKQQIDAYAANTLFFLHRLRAPMEVARTAVVCKWQKAKDTQSTSR